MKDYPPSVDKTEAGWEVNYPSEGVLRVNVGSNEPVEIDKLFGPLSASTVRVTLIYEHGVSDWVVEHYNSFAEKWEEKARWDCQEHWPKEGET